MLSDHWEAYVHLNIHQIISSLNINPIHHTRTAQEIKCKGPIYITSSHEDADLRSSLTFLSFRFIDWFFPPFLSFLTKFPITMPPKRRLSDPDKKPAIRRSTRNLPQGLGLFCDSAVGLIEIRYVIFEPCSDFI